MAQKHAQTKLCPGLERDERDQIRRELWQRELDAGLSVAGKNLRDAPGETKSAAWKIELARRLRQKANAPYSWIAATLAMGAPSSVRAI